MSIRGGAVTHGLALLLACLGPFFPAPAPLGAQETLVDLPTGVRLHVVVRGPDSGPALVLLHGYPDSSYSFDRLLPHLPSGMRIVAPDLRGHGRSSRPAGGYGMDGHATDVLALMDALGIRTATVLGHSMGSLVAQRMAARAPGRVESLVLVGSGASARGIPGLEELLAAVGALEDPVPEDFIRSFQESTVAAPVPAAFMDRVVSESLLVPSRVLRTQLEALAVVPPLEAGAVAAPTLILWGSEDGVFPRGEQAELLERIPGARWIEYPGIGHAPHWEAPERVAADLVAFLAEPGEEAAGD